MKFLAVALCGLLLLSACAVYKDKSGQTHYELLPPPPAVAYVPVSPPPPPPPVYYAPAEPPAYYVPAPQPGVVIEGPGSGPGSDHDRANRVQANCNTQWTGCSNVCNTNRDPSQRAVCVANCNHARDLCVRKNLGY
jgi:hypothetical protein